MVFSSPVHVTVHGIGSEVLECLPRALFSRLSCGSHYLGKRLRAESDFDDVLGNAIFSGSFSQKRFRRSVMLDVGIQKAHNPRDKSAFADGIQRSTIR